MAMASLHLALWLLGLCGAAAGSRPLVVHASGASPLETLAGQEVQRYLSLLTATTRHEGSRQRRAATTTLNLDPKASSSSSSSMPDVVVATLDHPLLRDYVHVHSPSHSDPAGHAAATTPFARAVQAVREGGGDAHLVHTVSLTPTSTVVVCAGLTPRATLYAAYALAERCGARFYLHGEVLPDPEAAAGALACSGVATGIATGIATGVATGDSLGDSLLSPLPYMSEVHVPRFSVRGIQPFHDFPMGPDFWQPEFWRALATNMAKMKLNFFGFHTYPLQVRRWGEKREEEDNIMFTLSALVCGRHVLQWCAAVVCCSGMLQWRINSTT